MRQAVVEFTTGVVRRIEAIVARYLATHGYVPGGGGTPGTLTDGDKGDITVSGGGATWQIDAGAVGAAELSPTAITGQTLATAVVTDYVLISDTSAGGALRKALASDLAGSPIGSASIAFTDGDTARRTTIADASVTVTSKILLSVTRPTVTAENDRGFLYTVNVVSRGAGTFDVFTICTDMSGDDPVLDPPNETVTLYYTVAN